MLYKSRYYELHFDKAIIIKTGQKDYVFSLPMMEVDNKNTTPGELLNTQKRDMANGGTEFKLSLNLGHNAVLELYIICHNDTPFVRIKYELRGLGAYLTKPNARDNFIYTQFLLPELSDITEISLNQYESTRHAYVPQMQLLEKIEYSNGEKSFAGPILMAQYSNQTFFCGYEHGGEYTDNFIKFGIKMENEQVRAKLYCFEGTYCSNHYFDDSAPYTTPYFHIGITNDVDGLQYYRDFILNYMAEYNSSRKPYIFYNTWNNQERNVAYRGRKYLEDMNTAQIIKEIEIANKMGIDVFVIDTGWYIRTGDWEVDTSRFEDDLEKIRDLLDKYGMKLGLWFNPSAAAISSKIARENPEYIKQINGENVNIGPVWETEQSYGMCLVSGYSDWFIEKLVEIGKRYNVRYFKWDAVDMMGCNCPSHNHGAENNTPEERELNFRFQCGMQLTRIASEVSKRLDGAIVDLDITEGRRYVGLGFLAAGKFFYINNGPYYHDFDIPNAKITYKNNWNVFFYPGSARNRVCRQSLAYDKIIPSILFLTHFLPDRPLYSQKETLASLILGGNGIWGDLLEMQDDDIELFCSILKKYKNISYDILNAYPKRRGFIGASPEIYEKINYKTSRGIIVLFSREPAEIEYYTQILEQKQNNIDGADEYEYTDDGHLKIKVNLGKNDSRIVFIG